MPSVQLYNNNHQCRFGLVNTRSIRNKTEQFLHHAVTEDLDFCIVTETWLKSSDQYELASLSPPGYGFLNFERESRTGGGIGIFFKGNIIVHPIKNGELASLEFVQIHVSIGKFKITVVGIYRPPFSRQHPVTKAVFFEEFGDFISEIFLTSDRCIIVGDFNIHINKPDDADATALHDLLNAFSLNQLVCMPTHTSGNIFDLVLVRDSCDFTTRCVGTDFFISDHSFVHCTLSTCKPVLEHKNIKIRKLKYINEDAFVSDLKDALNTVKKQTNLHDLIDKYDSCLSKVLDQHAPVISKKVTIRPKVPWFDNDAKMHKNNCRIAERR